MKRDAARKFPKKLERALLASGKHIQGIRLRRRQCGEIAFARTPKIAEQFGWSKLTCGLGPKYTGLCIDCGKLDIDRQA